MTMPHGLFQQSGYLMCLGENYARAPQGFRLLGNVEQDAGGKDEIG